MAQKYAFSVESTDKMQVFQQAAGILLQKGFKLIDLDLTKPWGFYMSVDESQSDKFIQQFYSGVRLQGIDIRLPLRPKFLGIQPGMRLSWQYHHRRAEIWHCLAGEFQLVTSENDQEKDSRLVTTGQVVNMPQGMRHRGVGLRNWALIAEIWQHTDIHKPSDEEDIVRVQDDFGR